MARMPRLSVDGLLNALDLGVLGNGTTDDGPALTAALTLAQQWGRNLQLPAGRTYRIASTVTIPAGGRTGLVGDGPGTLLQMDGTASVAVGIDLPNVASKNPDVVLRDFTLDGDRARTGGNGQAIGINLRACDDLIIEGVEVRNVNGIGISHQGHASLDLTVIQTWRRVWVHHCAGPHAIRNSLRTRLGTYDEVMVTDNDGNGIYIDHSESDVQGIIAEGNLGHGVLLHNIYGVSASKLRAARNGLSGIMAVGMVDCRGSDWISYNNGKNMVTGTLSAAAAQGATSISVAAGAGNPVPVAGQWLTIGSTGSQHTSKVRTVTGSGPYVCALVTALPAAQASGAQVVGGRADDVTPAPITAADVYLSADSAGNYGVTSRLTVDGITAGRTPIGGEAVRSHHSVHVDDGVTGGVSLLGLQLLDPGRTGAIRLPAAGSRGTLTVQQADGTFLSGGSTSSSSSPVVVAASKSAATVRNNTAVNTSDPHLVLTVAASTVYHLDGLLIVDTTQAADLKLSLSLLTGMSLTWWAEGPATANTTAATVLPLQFGGVSLAHAATTTANTTIAVGGAATAAGTPIAVRLRGTLRVGSTGGQVVLQWAQSTATAVDTTLRADSQLVLIPAA